MIGTNTIYGLDLFGDGIEDSFIYFSTAPNTLEYFDFNFVKEEILEEVIEEKLKDIGFTVLINLSLFPEKSLSDIEQNKDSSDFRIEKDTFHTPDWLSDMATIYLNEEGYTVSTKVSDLSDQVNPIPKKYFHTNSSVRYLGIGINSKLVVNDVNMSSPEIKKLGHILKSIISPSR